MRRVNRQIIAVLSASSLIAMGAQVVSPLISDISQAFPDSPPAVVKLIFSVISFMSFFMSFLVGVIVYRKKKALLIGIGCFVTGGLICAVINNIYIMLIFRCLTGFGCGIISPVASSLIADLTRPEERTRNVSLHTMCMQIGSVASSAVAGYLAVINWRLAFLIYGIGIISFILVSLWVPEIVAEKKEKSLPQGKVPGAIWFFAAINLCYGMVFCSGYINMSMGAAELGISAKECGVANSMSALGALISSMMTPYIVKYLKKWTMSVLWTIVTVLFFGLSMVTNAFQIGVYMFLMGFFGGPINIIAVSLAVYNSNIQNSVRCTSIVAASGVLGSFLCPFVFEFVGRLIGNSSTLFGYRVNGAECLCIALLCGIYFMIIRKDAWKV
jgi:MFS family permease